MLRWLLPAAGCGGGRELLLVLGGGAEFLLTLQSSVTAVAGGGSLCGRGCSGAGAAWLRGARSRAGGGAPGPARAVGVGAGGARCGTWSLWDLPGAGGWPGPAAPACGVGCSGGGPGPPGGARGAGMPSRRPPHRHPGVRQRRRAAPNHPPRHAPRLSFAYPRLLPPYPPIRLGSRRALANGSARCPPPRPSNRLPGWAGRRPGAS